MILPDDIPVWTGKEGNTPEMVRYGLAEVYAGRTPHLIFRIYPNQVNRVVALMKHHPEVAFLCIHPKSRKPLPCDKTPTVPRPQYRV